MVSFLFMAKYDIFAPFHFGFTEFQIQSETLRKISETLHTNETVPLYSVKVILGLDFFAFQSE